MWNILKPSSSRTLRRHERGREIPRSGIESLERRECPTVVFGLESGVLSITGDDGANVIEVSEPREGLVLVVGDGVRRTFRGVNQIVIDAKGGDDEIEMFNPKELGVDKPLPPHQKLKIDAGAGNDRITIGDGPVNGQHRHFSGFVSRISLGTGRDNLRVALNNSHNVGLDVLSADGGDVIEVGILFSVCQHPNGPSTVCGLRASLQLGGGDNNLDLRTEGSGNVDLELVAAGGGNNILISEDTRGERQHSSPARSLSSHMKLVLPGDGNRIDINTQGYDQVDLDLDLTGNSNSVVVGLLVPAVQKIREAAARVNVDLGGNSNFVSVNSDGFDDVGLDLWSGDYSTIQVGLLLPAIQKIREAAARIDINVGANSFVDVSLENIDDVDLNIVSEPATPQSATGGVINVQWQNINKGSGNAARDEMVKILTTSVAGGSGVSRSDGVTPDSLSFSARAGNAHSAPSMNATLKTGAADDTVSILTRRAGDLKLAVDTGGGDDAVTIQNQPLRWFSVGPAPINQHISIITGDGDDTAVYEDYLPLQAGNRWMDAVLGMVVDLGAGNDLADIRIEGFSKASLNLTAGEGDDDVLVKVKPMFAITIHDLDGQRLNIDALLGDGDDRLDIDIAGYTAVNAVLDAGAGNDSIRCKMSSVIDRTNVKVDRARFDFFAQLGEGSDTLLLETLGGREIKTVIDTGPAGDGRDRISASHQSLRRSGPVQRRHLAFDRGMDVYELLAVGYTVQINMTSQTRQFTLIQEL